MERKNTEICVPNSVEMRLLHDCWYLVPMQRKLVSDLIGGMQVVLSRKKPLFGKLSKNFDDSASTLRSPNYFEIPNLLLHSTHLEHILQ